MFDLIKKYVDDIPSYILDDDIRLYIKYGGLVPDNGTIVDIGTGLGKSMVALSKAAPQAVVYTFDNAEYILARKQHDTEWDYRDYIQDLITDKNCSNNVVFEILDVLANPYKFHDEIDLLHVDCESGIEEKVLKKYFPEVTHGGYILIRNYDRFTDAANEIVGGCKYLENMGKIQVVRKP